MDAANMFHNLLVPEEARHLFPLEVTDYEDCTESIQADLSRLLPKHPATVSLFRPVKATTPMRLTWFMILAHVCMQQNNDSAYEELGREKPWMDARIQFTRHHNAPFTVNPRPPLVPLIFDDQANITCGCSDAPVWKKFNKKLRRRLAGADILISCGRSSAPGDVD